jgi:hypothetical protein
MATSQVSDIAPTSTVILSPPLIVAIEVVIKQALQGLVWAGKGKGDIL